MVIFNRKSYGVGLNETVVEEGVGLSGNGVNVKVGVSVAVGVGVIT